MKRLILFFVFFISHVVVYGQKTDYKRDVEKSYKLFNVYTKNGLKALLKNQPLEEVLKNTTAIARDTLNKYNNLLTNTHFAGPYTLKEFNAVLRKNNINFDLGFKTAAQIIANTKQPENKRIAALQIVFGLNRILNLPLKVTNLTSRDEFIDHDIFLEWKNRDSNDNIPLTAYQLYDAYKLGVRIAQSRGNKQLTDYFNAKADTGRVGWIMYYLDRAFFNTIKGDVGIQEIVDGPTSDTVFLPGEKEPVYTMMAAIASFPNGYNEFYKVMSEHLHYPAEEWNRGIEGEVSVLFDVEKDGTISHARVSPSLTPDIDAEVLRAIKFLPKMIPGHIKSNPTPVRTFQAYSVNFIIQPGKERENDFIPPFNKKKKEEDLKPETSGRKIDFFHYVNKNSTYHGPPFGSVSLKYTVQVSGEVNGITVLRHLSPAADTEAVRLLRETNVWKPGPLVKIRKNPITDSLSVYFHKPPVKN